MGKTISFKRPDGLTLVGAMPVTPNFKIDKRALRAMRDDA